MKVSFHFQQIKAGFIALSNFIILNASPLNVARADVAAHVCVRHIQHIYLSAPACGCSHAAAAFLLTCGSLRGLRLAVAQKLSR